MIVLALALTMIKILIYFIYETLNIFPSVYIMFSSKRDRYSLKKEHDHPAALIELPYRHTHAQSNRTDIQFTLYLKFLIFSYLFI